MNAGGGEDDFALTRFRPTDGFDDNGFSTDGRQTTDRGGVEQAKAVAIQADDKIVVAGISGPPGDFNWAVARYRALDGSPDTTWSPDGWRETDFGAAQEYANDVAIQPDGKIVVAGARRTRQRRLRARPLQHRRHARHAASRGDGKQTTDLRRRRATIADRASRSRRTAGSSSRAPPSPRRGDPATSRSPATTRTARSTRASRATASRRRTSAPTTSPRA